MMNMSMHLSICTKEKQRSILRLLWAQGVQGAEIQSHLCPQYGDSALPCRSVYKWIKMFKNGWRSARLQLGISQGTAYSLVHDILGFHKVSTRWVPRHLIGDHQHNHHSICSILMEQYNHEGNNFLNHIITRDETGIHHYEPETQWHSMQWKHMSSPSCKKFKPQPSARKLLLTVDIVLGLPMTYP